MKVTRTAVTILLLLFVVVTVGTLIAQEVSRPEPQVADSSNSESAKSDVDVNSQVVSADVVPDVVLDDEPETVAAIQADGEGVDAVNVDDASVSVAAPIDLPCVIEAVYFHNTHRCYTCLKIEGDAKAIVEEIYADEFASGKLVWSAVNMEEDRSAIVTYDLTSPSLVLIRKSGDEIVDWLLLDETWSLVRSTTRFSAYIISSFETFMEGCL